MEIAKSKTVGAGLDVEYIHSDMRAIPFRSELDAVINMYSSFGFLETEGRTSASSARSPVHSNLGAGSSST